MKKILVLLTFLPCMLYGQIFVDGKNLNELPDLEYIFVSYGLFGAHVGYSIGPKSFSGKAKNAKGENLSFGGSVAVLNYFYQNGWEFQSKEDTLDYIFKKRKP